MSLHEIPEFGITNKDYAAVAASSLAVAALIMGIIHAGYASMNAKAEAVAEAEALAARVAAEEEASELQVSPAVITNMSAAQAAVENIVSGYGENVAVSVRMLDGSGNFDINGDESMQSASMIKLLVLAEYLDELDVGAICADDTYELAYSDVVGGSGTMQGDPVGTEYTLDEVARRMVAASDNVGTNVLIERMGVEQIQAKADELGLAGTQIAHKLMIGANDGKWNMISANDAARILTRVAGGTLASADSCARAEEYLLEQEDGEGLAQGLPDGVAFGHKTGTVDNIRHDGGIVYAEHPYVICVLTKNVGYDTANTLMAQISAVVYEAIRACQEVCVSPRSDSL